MSESTPGVIDTSDWEAPPKSLIPITDADWQTLKNLRKFMYQNAGEIIFDFTRQLRRHEILNASLETLNITLESVEFRERQHLIEITTISRLEEYQSNREQEINAYRQAGLPLNLYLTMQNLINHSLYIKMMVKTRWYQRGKFLRSLLVINKLQELDRQQAIRLYTQEVGGNLKKQLQGVTTSIEHLSDAARQIATNAQVVSLSIEGTLQAAQTGYQHVGQTIEGTEHVQRRVTALSSQIIELSQKVGEISTIIDLIKEVTDETDILAINASVESAGAGEVGRRFNVVASEIRRLSDRVRQSAGQIETLIYEVQLAVTSAVKAADASVRQSREGVELAYRAGSAVSQVVGNIQESTNVIHEISQATGQQDQVSSEVATAMQNISTAVAELETITAES